MIEEWRAVPGYEAVYAVSSLGAVRSERTRKMRVLFAHKKRGGYLYVPLYLRGRQRMHKVHRLVLAAFVGECPSGHEGSHINGDPSDNRVGNLEWTSHASNEARKPSRGTHPRAMPPATIERMRDLRRAGLLQREVGDWLGFKQSVVSQIERGKRRANG
jgi:HNH endonuclease/NUMOD4 motif